MRMYDIIMKKRNGGELSREEIDYFIKGYTKGEIPDYQVSALMMAIYFRKMTEAETLALTMAMAHSGDFLDLKAYEPEMRYLIDNYISASEAVKLGAFDDFTLLDFILSQQNDLSENPDPAVREGAAETIENNIRKKVVERQAINPAYYARMSAVLEQIIARRKRDVDAYRTLIQQYADLVRRIDAPENTGRYPESIRASAARGRCTTTAARTRSWPSGSMRRCSARKWPISEPTLPGQGG